MFLKDRIVDGLIFVTSKSPAGPAW